MINEKTKKKIKGITNICGSLGGSFAASYFTSVLTAICPPIGIPAKIGEFLIGIAVSEKCASSVMAMTDSIIDTIETLESSIDKNKESSEIKEEK